MMKTKSQERRRGGILALVGLCLLMGTMGGLSLAGAAVADDGGDGGIGITVSVAPTTPDATGTGFGGTESPSPTPSASNTPGPEDNSLGGIIFVSGLSARYIWSANPIDSKVALEFTVRNVSTSTFSSAARFWVDTPFGNRVGQVASIPIRKLKPNESRVIATTIAGVGQWTALHSHVTFTPPPVVDGKKLGPVTRDSFVVVPPVFGGYVALITAAVFLVFKFLSFSGAAALSRGTT